MNENKILHVMILDKFLAPFIDFVDEHFGRENHHYVFITSEKYEFGLTPEHKVEFLHTDDDIFITLLEYMKIAKRIIHHGLWRDKVDVLLYFNQELLKKCYWIMWGGDYYFPEKQSQIRHNIIKNMGNYISATKHDIEYLKERYEIKSNNFFFSQYYPNCISDFEYVTNELNNKKLKILIGNSATYTNRHKEVFEILKQYKDQNIEIIVPLNYGNKEYKDEIIKEATSIFQNKFNPIVDFIEFDAYKKILLHIDIAIFNNNRQQAGANIKLLIGYGKKVYISKENSFYKELKYNNITIFDIENFNLKKISLEIAKKNRELALKYYSLDSLIESWKGIFNSK